MSESCPQDSEQLTATALLSQTSHHRHRRHRSGDDAAAADHSSSTEGPDSPCASSSGSPVPMMMPVPPYRSSVSYDDDDFERDVPRYRVVFTGDVSKDGDALKYRMLARSLASSASADVEPEAPVELERQWEDFDQLHRQLVSRHAVAGVIVPPLPPKPAADAREAEARSRRRVGSSSFFSRSGSVESAVGAVGGGGGGASARCYVQGDDFDRDCVALSAYLEAMLAHPHFGRSPLFVEFLEQQEAPSRTKAKKGIFSGMKQSLDFGLKMPTSSSIK